MKKYTLGSAIRTVTQVGCKVKNHPMKTIEIYKPGIGLKPLGALDYLKNVHGYRLIFGC